MKRFAWIVNLSAILSLLCDLQFDNKNFRKIIHTTLKNTSNCQSVDLIFNKISQKKCKKLKKMNLTLIIAFQQTYRLNHLR